MDNRFLIRPMQAEDVPEVTELEKNCFADPWSKESFLREVTQNKLASYVVITDQQKQDAIAGYAGMWIVFDEAHITNIAVLPDYRGMSLGKRLMVRQIKDSMVAGCDKMSLEVRVSNLAAIALYRGLGFTETGIRKEYYEDNKEDALIMWKYYEEESS